MNRRRFFGIVGLLLAAAAVVLVLMLARSCHTGDNPQHTGDDITMQIQSTVQSQSPGTGQR